MQRTRLHQKIATGRSSGRSAETDEQVQKLYKERGDTVSTSVVRRELHKWLVQSDEGKQVETLVKQLLA